MKFLLLAVLSALTLSCESERSSSASPAEIREAALGCRNAISAEMVTEWSLEDTEKDQEKWPTEGAVAAMRADLRESRKLVETRWEEMEALKGKNPYRQGLLEFKDELRKLKDAARAAAVQDKFGTAALEAAQDFRDAMSRPIESFKK